MSTEEISQLGLNASGNLLLEQFQNTGHDEYICQAITVYEQAVDSLSEDDPRIGISLQDLACAYRARYAEFREVEDLEKAITSARNAVALTPEEDTNFPGFLSNLGSALSLRFECTEDPGDISEAIRNQQRAVQLTPDDHADLPARLNSLGKSFSVRFERRGNYDDISDAIRIQERAVRLTPEGHSDLPDHLTRLGRSCVRFFERTGNLEDISRAIRIQQRVVELTPDGYNLASMLSNLGSSFSRRFERTGDNDDISEAIRIQQRAVQLLPDGSKNLPDLFANLGTTYSNRFQHTGELGDSSEAIRNLRRAVQLTPDGHASLPIHLNNLGYSHFYRFQRTGDVGDLSEAIQELQRAVQLHSDSPYTLNHLGSSLTSRFELTGDVDDISEAIRTLQRAVRFTPEGHALLPGIFSNLGHSFMRRFGRTRELDDISEAIRIQLLATQLVLPDDVNLPIYLSNLGNSLQNRFRFTENPDDISESIRVHRRAVQLTSDVDPSLSRRLNDLGIVISDHFRRTGDLDGISEAIQIQKRAIQLIPDGHGDLPSLLNNLGSFLEGRFKLTGNLGDISEAVRNQQRAIQLTPVEHANLSLFLKSLGRSFQSRFEHTGDFGSLKIGILNYRLSATQLTGSPHVRLEAARRWAGLLRNSPFESEQLQAHECIIQLLSLISGLENTIQFRHQSLIHTSQLSIAAAAAALSLGHSDKAVEWLVQGRCIVWNQMIQLRNPLDKLRLYDPALADRFSVLSRELEVAGLRPDSLGRKAELSMEDKMSLEVAAGLHIKRAKDWKRLLDTIRDIDGFGDFLQPKKCHDIMRKLPDEGPVIIINIHHDRSDALALMAGADEPIHIPLPKFSYQKAERLAKGLRSYLFSLGVRSRLCLPLGDDDSPIPHIEFPEVLSVLWSDIALPVLEGLGFSRPVSSEKLTRIWWCPTGPLAFLPIHAAGNYDNGKAVPGRCLSDFAVSSYIPTVDVFNSVKKSCDVRSGFLMISQSVTPGMGDLPNALSEVEKITKQLEMRKIPFSVLNHEKATVQSLSQSMEQFPCIHLACHASQNITDPLKSSIYLHDGQLELSDIMKKNLQNSGFAFLSACQTSKGDTNLPEEVVHLASGMLAAGYQSVVGTMWSIYDEHGSDLAELFYENFLGNSLQQDGPGMIDGRGAARALDDATRRLREKVSDFLAWVPYTHIGI